MRGLKHPPWCYGWRVRPPRVKPSACWFCWRFPQNAQRTLQDEHCFCGLTAVLTTWCLVRGLRMWAPFPRPAELGLGIQWAVRAIAPVSPACTRQRPLQWRAPFCAGQRPIAWVGLSYAALIAWSRLCLGLHFPSDVLAGALTGLGCTAIAVRFCLSNSDGSANFQHIGSAWRPMGSPQVMA